MANEATELAILKRREQRWHMIADENRKQSRNHYSQGNLSQGYWHLAEAEKCDRMADITRKQIQRLQATPAIQTNTILETMLLGEALGVVTWNTHNHDWSETP